MILGKGVGGGMECKELRCDGQLASPESGERVSLRTPARAEMPLFSLCVHACTVVDGPDWSCAFSRWRSRPARFHGADLSRCTLSRLACWRDDRSHLQSGL